MKAYEIVICQEPATRNNSLHAGWCFGLPPGIKPEQWPLDPDNGYPLVHGFTILIPEDYRCRGPEIVALSFFGTPEDMDIGEGGPFIDENIRAALSVGAAEPTEPDLKFLWLDRQRAHPRLYELNGVHDARYAVILLTRSEYSGDFCPPPTLRPNSYRDKIDPPLWLESGAAFAVASITTDTRLLRVLGGQPSEGHSFNRALRFRTLEDDLNAGKEPRDPFSLDETGYEDCFYETAGKLERYEWAKRTSWIHFGGTMRPGQCIPAFSPFYLEFEQYLGGFNFAGGGTAQLDLESMRFNVMGK